MESIFIPQGAEGGCPKCGASKPTCCACSPVIDELRRIADRQGNQTNRAIAKKTESGYEVHIGKRLVASCSIEWAAVLTSVLNLPYADILSLLSQERERREAAGKEVERQREVIEYGANLANDWAEKCQREIQRRHDDLRRINEAIRSILRKIGLSDSFASAPVDSLRAFESDVVDVFTSLRQQLQAAQAEVEGLKAEVNHCVRWQENQRKAREADACTECKGRGEIGYMTETELGPEGDSEVCSACAGSGSQAVADVIESWGEQDEINRLQDDLGVLLIAAAAYCEAPPQMRGATYRDLSSTVDWLKGRRDNLLGWPDLFDKLAQKLDTAEKEIASLQSQLSVAQTAAKEAQGRAITDDEIRSLILAAVTAEAWFTHQECIGNESLNYDAFQAADQLRGALQPVESKAPELLK